eukprot:m.195721 g.195721  ORF g.195721 m.195721 type:complete len:228 (+) comp15235_c0_seq11:38-721(+)
MATLCAVSAVLCMSQLPGVLRPAASGSTQTAAVTALAERLLGQSASWIDFVVVPPDGPPPTSWGAMQAPWYEITDSGNVSAPVRIKGSSGVAVARGLHRYLTEYLNGSVTWGRPRATGIQLDNVPTTAAGLPIVTTPIHVDAAAPVHWYLNSPTTVYTMAWWTEQDWLDEVDWMALHGIDTPLAAFAMEVGVLQSETCDLLRPLVLVLAHIVLIFSMSKLSFIFRWD